MAEDGIKPVDASTLEALDTTTQAYTTAAVEVAELELHKITLLRLLRQTKTTRDELLAKILAERGLHPRSVVEIDSVTGAITVVEAPPPDPVSDNPLRLSLCGGVG